LDYFSAVQLGKSRVQRAVEVLQEVAGPSYPVLFLKERPGEWTPVGEETLCSVVKGEDNLAAVIVCDSDGNAKAMSVWLTEDKAQELAAMLEAGGMSRFGGEVRLPK
jgi:hypothetical protein